MKRAPARPVGAPFRCDARARRGQSTVEAMLLISVLVIGLLVAAYAFLPGFSRGVTDLGADATELLTAGGNSGSGDMR